jgi:hypothetical protein
MPVMRQEPYEYAPVDNLPYEAEIVTNRVLAIAELINTFATLKDAQDDIVALRKLVMSLLIDDPVGTETQDSEPISLDNSDIE